MQSNVWLLSWYSHCSFDQLNMSKQSPTTRGTDLPFSHKSFVLITHEQNFATKHLQTVICRSRGVLSANEMEGIKGICETGERAWRVQIN